MTLFVCLSIRLSVCRHDNSRTVRDIIAKISGHHFRVKGCPSSGCAAGDLTSDFLLCNGGAFWRIIMKDVTNTITDIAVREW